MIRGREKSESLELSSQPCSRAGQVGIRDQVAECLAGERDQMGKLSNTYLELKALDAGSRPA